MEVKSVDREIALLKQVRALLSGPTGAAPRKPAGRPKKCDGDLHHANAGKEGCTQKKASHP